MSGRLHENGPRWKAPIFWAHSGGVQKSRGLSRFSTSQAQFDDDDEPMTMATCGVGSLLARRYGDLRAVFAAHLPQSTKSKSTKLLRMPRFDAQVVLRR